MSINVIRRVPYGKSDIPAAGVVTVTPIYGPPSTSSPGQVRVEGVQDHTRMHVLRHARVAKVGAWGRGRDRPDQIRVRHFVNA